MSRSRRGYVRSSLSQEEQERVWARWQDLADELFDIFDGDKFEVLPAIRDVTEAYKSWLGDDGDLDSQAYLLDSLQELSHALYSVWHNAGLLRRFVIQLEDQVEG